MMRTLPPALPSAPSVAATPGAAAVASPAVRAAAAAAAASAPPSPVWLEEMRTWLRAQGQSQQNMRSTMKVVCALAGGHGVAHPKGRPPFCDGLRVDISDDLEALKQRAAEWLPAPDDSSKGWKIAHPLRKLIAFKAQRASSSCAFSCAPSCAPAAASSDAVKESLHWRQPTARDGANEAVEPGAVGPGDGAESDNEEDRPLAARAAAKRRPKGLKAPLQTWPQPRPDAARDAGGGPHASPPTAPVPATVAAVPCGRTVAAERDVFAEFAFRPPASSPKP